MSEMCEGESRGGLSSPGLGLGVLGGGAWFKPWVPGSGNLLHSITDRRSEHILYFLSAPRNELFWLILSAGYLKCSTFPTP